MAGCAERFEVDFEWARGSPGSLMTNLLGNVGDSGVDPDATSNDLIHRTGELPEASVSEELRSEASALEEL